MLHDQGLTKHSTDLSLERRPLTEAQTRDRWLFSERHSRPNEEWWKLRPRQRARLEDAVGPVQVVCLDRGAGPPLGTHGSKKQYIACVGNVWQVAAAARRRHATARERDRLVKSLLGLDEFTMSLLLARKISRTAMLSER